MTSQDGESFKYDVKQAGESLEMQNNCAEIKIRAERRIGEFSKELDKSKGGKPFHKSYPTHDGESKSNVLKSAGIKHHERYEAIADIPEDKFEKHIAEIKD